MDKGLDTGDMIMKGEIKLDDHMTASILHDKLADMGANIVLDVIGRLACGEKVETQKQDDNASTYAPLLKKSDGQVDWNSSAIEIDRQVRALNPWPGVWAEIQGKRFKILDVGLAHAEGFCHENSASGTLLNKNGLILCGEKTALTLKSLQPEGKKVMDFTSALNGSYINADIDFNDSL